MSRNSIARNEIMFKRTMLVLEKQQSLTGGSNNKHVSNKVCRLINVNMQANIELGATNLSHKYLLAKTLQVNEIPQILQTILILYEY